MPKITVEMVKSGLGHESLVVSNEEAEWVYRIAGRAFDLFERAGWDDGLEVIKCTVWRQHQYSAKETQSSYFLMVNFQLPITLPHYDGLEEEFSRDNRLVVKVEWRGHHTERLQVYQGEKFVGGGDIALKDTEIETVARGLVQAVWQTVNDRQRRVRLTKEWLDRVVGRLASVLEEQAAA